MQDLPRKPTARPDHPQLLAWQTQILEAARQGQPLALRGGGSKAFYGHPLQGSPLDTTTYRGILAYEPTELVITARCGTPLAEIEATLAERRQMLAWEPPRYAAGATMGGVVASGLSGPRRMQAGATRDFVLGLRLLDGRGQLLSFGGQVMKNVAGYDLARMLTGSLGCYGILTDLSLKVLPCPRAELSLAFSFDEGSALAALNRWAGQPLPISASCWENGVLHLRLSGAEAAVAAAHQRLGGSALAPDAADALWASLRDQTHPFFTPGGQHLIRLALPDTAPPLQTPGAGPVLIEWGGAQRWYRGDTALLTRLRSQTQALGGHTTLFRAAPDQAAAPVFTPLAPALLRIHQSLKQSFDPAGVFNRGRMYQEL
jgi:glycolate oxidase FAD binding subunit